MKKNIIKAVIAVILIIGAVVGFNLEANAKINPDEGIEFCSQGDKLNCYKKPNDVGWTCGEGPWLDCDHSWIME